MGLQHEENVREGETKKAVLTTKVCRFLSNIFRQRNEFFLDYPRLFGGRGGLRKNIFHSVGDRYRNKVEQDAIGVLSKQSKKDGSK